jgi:catechol 2,3-dioxygenase-like lactoylglutathione lyase family enzyme
MPTVDERPPIWVGHVVLRVADPEQSAPWWESLGLRPVYQGADVSILELRGGTHLILAPGEPERGDAPFDLMVDDVDATHARLTEQGLAPSEIQRGEIHDAFTLTDPDGYVVSFSNSHVVGPV